MGSRGSKNSGLGKVWVGHGGGLPVGLEEILANHPAPQEKKLQVMVVDEEMISWITEYLTGRPQFVRPGSVLYDVVVSDTESPQGMVLSPSLPILYTTDFQYNSESCHLQKFSSGV